MRFSKRRSVFSQRTERGKDRAAVRVHRRESGQMGGERPVPGAGSKCVGLLPLEET